jgi:putative zinc finger/helix-turn-helix YgiT family protein
MKKVRGPHSYLLNGERIVVPSVEYLKCPRCGDSMIGIRALQRQHEEAVDIYRRRHGLLSADEIRALRKELALNQAALASLLRLGANTVSRWESGRNVQSAGLDILLRMVRDVPEVAAYLRKHAA